MMFNKIISSILFMFILTMVSCYTGKNNSIKQNHIDKKDEVLLGVWVNKQYCDDLLKTMSPSISYDKLIGISSIEFYKERDNLVAGLVYNNHEGTSSIVEGDSIRIHKNGVTKLYSIKVLSDSTLRISDVNFLKINQEASDSPIDYITNKIFFKDRPYIAVNNGDTLKDIIFLAKGEILNYKYYNSYEILSDFMVVENRKDLIIFRNNDNKSKKSFHYKVAGDTILLFDKSDSNMKINHKLYSY